MDIDKLDISYTDIAVASVGDDGTILGIHSYLSLSPTDDHAYFFLRIQPAPHAPAYRTAYLIQALESTLLTPSARYNSIAEIYFYYVCSLQPALIRKCPGLAIIGAHAGLRITNHWEPMGFAALAIMEQFMSIIPNTCEGTRAKTFICQAAFHTWRALPYDFPVIVRRRFMRVAMHTTRQHLCGVGGNYFRILSYIFGPFTTGAILRRIRGAPYSKLRSLSNNQLDLLVENLDIH